MPDSHSITDSLHEMQVNRIVAGHSTGVAHHTEHLLHYQQIGLKTFEDVLLFLISLLKSKGDLLQTWNAIRNSFAPDQNKFVSLGEMFSQICLFPSGILLIYNTYC